MFVQCAGNWNNSSDAGVFYRNWNNNRSNDNNNNGFRSSDCVSIPEIPKGNTGDIGSILSCHLAKSARDSFLVPKGSVSYA